MNRKITTLICDIVINSECDFGIKHWKLNSVNKLENTVFGRQTFSKRYSTTSKCKTMSTRAGNSWLSCSQVEVKKLATMLAPISFVFPPRKYPHKENMFFVESNWNKLGWIGISDLGELLNEDLKCPNTSYLFPGKWVRKVLGMIKRNFWNCPKKRQDNRLYSHSSPEAWISLCRLASIPDLQKDNDLLERI